ncbi:MAG: TetR/AcrR family transcriptional regulator [Rhodothermales bacterium]
MQSTISRKEKERLVRRNAILDAAQAEFAERGYGRAKLEDIAKRAEFGKGTLYNYFKGGKRGMLFAIFDKLYDDMIQLIEASFAPDVVAKSSFRDAFYDYTLSSLSFYLESKELFMILVKEAHRMCFGEDLDNASYFRQQQERVIAALTEPVQRAMESGQIRLLDPKAVAHMILGNIQGIQVHMILDAEGEARDSTSPPKEAAAFLTSMLLDGLGVHKPVKHV